MQAAGHRTDGFARPWWAVVALLCSGCGGPTLQHVIQRDLPATEGQSCPGYLGWNHANVQHVFLWLNGTGVYSSAFVHPSVEEALDANPAAYLTLDKPGIRAPFGDPAKLSVNDAELQRYTQGDILECAHQAMSWSDAQFGREVRFHLRGHSEGTLVALFLYEKLLSEEPALAARVSSLVLSGLGSFLAAIWRTPTRGRRDAPSSRVWLHGRRRRAFSCFKPIRIFTRQCSTCMSSRPGTRGTDTST